MIPKSGNRFSESTPSGPTRGITLKQSGDGPYVKSDLRPFPLPGTVIARPPKLPPGAALYFILRFRTACVS